MNPRAKRNLKPKPAVVVSPVLVSDETSFSIVGLRPRPFRELVDAHPELPRFEHGHRLLVPVDAIRALAKRAVDTDASELVLEDDGPIDPAEVIRLARRRTA